MVAALGGTPLSPDEFDAVPDGLPAAAHRDGEFLTQTVFSRYHSEHEMLRYLRRLSDRDLALDRTMIPLGSCTMKLNATSEMLPITWPEFADVHPFAPADQVTGYTTMIADLEARLAAITGYDARERAAERRQPGRTRRPPRHPWATTGRGATTTARSA